ncbi:hypothetical protein TNIN_223981 [Trichonephila inaurata madagascariensis]|uniref:Uncharacterized protein n=1 Tax=Trichonephila inaurata madagascariensis TaxID=2747483 RepID=A0A8X6WXG6_9ARAC|nr:hypothetical protein TNIN_223981 [Trichonephila inaurata madagascariensis]
MDTKRHPCPYRDSYRARYAFPIPTPTLRIRYRYVREWKSKYHANLREDRYPGLYRTKRHASLAAVASSATLYCAHLNRATASLRSFMPTFH